MHPWARLLFAAIQFSRIIPAVSFPPDSRAAQGCDEVRNLTKSKQPVNNFLNPVILFTTLPLPCLSPDGAHQM
jgi:hypothetical protein